MSFFFEGEDGIRSAHYCLEFRLFLFRSRIFRRGFAGLFAARGRYNRMQFLLFSALVFGPLVALQFIVQMILSFPSVDLSGGQGAIRTASLDAHLFESVAIIGTVNLCSI